MSKPSFEKINYSIRVAKAIERKMLSFSFKKLQYFDNLQSYRYIGFGSTFFHDYVLFHRELGITKMISIEKEKELKERFEFNKPYHCVNIQYDESNAVLPSIGWDDKTILWLDYDSEISAEKLGDLATFFTNAVSGSVFLITINAQAGAYGEDNDMRLKSFSEDLGEDKLPFDVNPIDFSNKKLPNTLKKILDQEIIRILNIRNGVLGEDDKLKYSPIYNFIYQDGAKMITIGGILYANRDVDKYELAKFADLDFVSLDSFFDIKNPSLTLKEIRLLNSQLPLGLREGAFVDEKIINPKIPTEDIVAYAQLYKFFPAFAESFVI